jgi:hypothetical protein
MAAALSLPAKIPQSGLTKTSAGPTPSNNFLEGQRRIIW